MPHLSMFIVRSILIVAMCSQSLAGRGSVLCSTSVDFNKGMKFLA